MAGTSVGLLDALADAPVSPDGWLFPTPRGKLWSMCSQTPSTTS